jgi:hypothetical protein
MTVTRRILGALILAVGVLAVVGGIGCLFAAIWAHGHDLPSRLAGTGFMALLFSPAPIVAGAAIGDW